MRSWSSASSATGRSTEQIHRKGDVVVVRQHLTVTPSAARLTGSLRDIGYDFPSAIADLVDNSVTAGATRIEVLIEFDGPDSTVLIIDDGVGMTSGAINEALRFGSRRHYGRDELGRYGLGLKTASLSQCRVLTVVSRRPGSGRTVVRELDLDLIQDHDEWLITDPGPRAARRPRDLLTETPGTIVAWNQLDRVLPEHRPDGRLGPTAPGGAGRADRGPSRHGVPPVPGRLPSAPRRHIVNGEKLQPWDPFALAERNTRHPGGTALRDCRSATDAAPSASAGTSCRRVTASAPPPNSNGSPGH